MAGIKHSTVVTKTNNPNYDVSTNNWNAEHSIDDSSIPINKVSNLSALSTSPSIEGVKITGTAGENLAIGNVVYLTTSGTWRKALATNVSTMTMLGMVYATISSGSSGTILLIGQMRYDSWGWATAGLLLYVSPTTSGLLTVTAPTGSGQIVQIVGITSGTNTIIVVPNLGTLTLT